jgi:hypothetical protein
MSGFKPLDVEVGEIVNWFPGHPSEPSLPAFVVARNEHGSLWLNVISQHNKTFISRDCVYHISDPRGGRTDERGEDGGWDVGPARRASLALEQRVAALESRLGELLALAAGAEAGTEPPVPQQNNVRSPRGRRAETVGSGTKE